MVIEMELETELKKLEEEQFKLHPLMLSITLLSEKRKLQKEEARINEKIEKLRQKLTEQRNNARNATVERELILNLRDLRWSTDPRLEELRQGFITTDMIAWEKMPALEFDVTVKSGRKMKINLRRLLTLEQWRELFNHPYEYRILCLESQGGYRDGKPVPYFRDPNESIVDEMKIRFIGATYLCVRMV
jgi:hypothetical protein